MVALQLEITEKTLDTAVTYMAANSISYNEWTYCGVSLYKTHRIGNSYEIHLVTKTIAGVESQTSFSGELLGTYNTYTVS